VTALAPPPSRQRRLLETCNRATSPIVLDSAGNEADLVLVQGSRLMLLEIKSARTVAPDAMRSIAAIRRSLGERVAWSAMVYDSDEAQRRSDFDVAPCRELQRWLSGG
jgi:hypothetical protein